MLIFAFTAGWLLATGHRVWGCLALAVALLASDWTTPVENLTWVLQHLTQ